MNRKHLLRICAVGLGFAGVAAFSVPFLLSLNPSAKADVALPRIDISHIEPGTFDVLEYPAPNELWGGFQWSLFVIRLHDGSLKVWQVLAKDGSVVMPDMHWWKPFFICDNFGPAMIRGKIDETSYLECHDESLPSEGWGKIWRWKLDGKHVGRSHADDMMEAKGVVEGRDFVYGKRR